MSLLKRRAVLKLANDLRLICSYFCLNFEIFEKHRDRQTDRQKEKETGRQTDRKIDRQKYRQTERQTIRQIDRDRQTETDRDGQTYIQTVTEINRNCLKRGKKCIYRWQERRGLVIKV